MAWGWPRGGTGLRKKYWMAVLPGPGRGRVGCATTEAGTAVSSPVPHWPSAPGERMVTVPDSKLGSAPTVTVKSTRSVVAAVVTVGGGSTGKLIAGAVRSRIVLKTCTALF